MSGVMGVTEVVLFLVTFIGSTQQPTTSKPHGASEGLPRGPSSPKRRNDPVLSPDELFRHVAPSVFIVEALNDHGSVTSVGSGVAVGIDEVVTNKHVVDSGYSLRLRKGNKTWRATVGYLDPQHDLCALKVQELRASPVPVRASGGLTVGERVYAIGAPEGLELTLSEGLISGLREFGGGHVIQTTAPISHGSSGGGLFDERGRLIGVTTFFVKEGQNLNFALPGDWVIALGTGEGSVRPRNEQEREFEALTWCQLALKALQEGKPPEFLRAKQQVVRLAPESPEGWFYLGLAYGLVQRDDEAVGAFKQATRLKADYPDAWYHLGTTLNTLGRYDEAVTALQEAVAVKPEDSEFWSTLGFSLWALNRYDEAARAEREAIRLNPNNAQAWHDLGSTYNALTHYDEGVKALRNAVRIEPDLHTAWNNLGLAYNALHQFDQAKQALQEALRLRPDYATSWYNLGLTYVAEGDRSGVLQVYQKLKTLDAEMADRFFREAVLPQ